MIQTVGQISDPYASFISSTVTTGGNPGGYIDTQMFYAGPNLGIHVAHMDSGAVVDLASLGGVSSLNFSFDAAFFNYPGTCCSPSFAVGYQPVVEQGGAYFLGNYVAAVSPGWVSFSLSNQGAGDFIVLNGTANPDFSSAGGDLTLGFVSFNGTGSAFSTSTHSGLDNFAVSTNAVAEPASLAVLAGAAGLLGGLRMRRRKLA